MSMVMNTLAIVSVRSSWLCAVALLCVAHPVRAEPRSPSADDAFGAYMQGAYDRLMQANPSLATEQGKSVGNDRWESIGESGAAAERLAAQQELANLRREFATAPLGPKARLQYRVFENSQQLLLDRYEWRNHLYPLNQIVGPPIDIPQVLASQKIDSVAVTFTSFKRAASKSARYSAAVRSRPPVITIMLRSDITIGRQAGESSTRSGITRSMTRRRESGVIARRQVFSRATERSSFQSCSMLERM